MQKDYFGHGGLRWGKCFSKFFSISYMLKSKNSGFDPYFLKATYPMQKTLVCIIRELKLLSFSWKNIIFFETFLWPFLWAILHYDCPRSAVDLIYIKFI